MATTGCLITSGIDFSCSERRLAAGGLRKTVWVGNIGELDQTQGDRGFDIDSEGNVTAIYFTQYGKLYAFEGVKDANSINDDITRTEGSGNVSFPVNVLFKVYDTSAADRAAIEDLAFADSLFAIVEHTGGWFELAGRIEGLTLATGPRDSGTNTNTDTGRVLTLSGLEPEMPKIFLDTDYATTRALIESYL